MPKLVSSSLSLSFSPSLILEKFYSRFHFRHSFEYSDKDEMVIAHLVGGIDAFLKISLGWPMLPSGLHLISIKGLDIHSKDISLASLFKIKVRTSLFLF